MNLPHAPKTLVALATLALSACATNGEIGVVNDPFAGEMRGFVLYLDLGHYTAVGANEKKGQYELDVLVVQRGDVREVAPIGAPGEFMVGGQDVALATAEESHPVANANENTVFTQWKLAFHLTPDQAKRFASGPLTAVKVTVGSTPYQLALDASDAAKVQNNFATLLAQVPAVAFKQATAAESAAGGLQATPAAAGH